MIIPSLVILGIARNTDLEDIFALCRAVVAHEVFNVELYEDGDSMMARVEVNTLEAVRELADCYDNKMVKLSADPEQPYSTLRVLFTD